MGYPLNVPATLACSPLPRRKVVVADAAPSFSLLSRLDVTIMHTWNTITVTIITQQIRRFSLALVTVFVMVLALVVVFRAREELFATAL
jgi:hypothetical protein